MLPPNWRIELDTGTRRTDNGTVLIGGTPFRLLRFNATGTGLLDRLAQGSPIGDGASAQLMARRLVSSGMAHPRPAGTTLTPADVTMVVPIHGSADELRGTLSHLGPRATCIVVDDASTDPTIDQVARDHHADVRRHATNRGPGAARNTGWKQATTEIVAFVDAGCTPEDGWLDALLPHFDDPQVVAVAPRVTSAIASTLPASLAAYEEARPSLDRGAIEAVVRPTSRVPFVPTAALLVRRTSLEASGGFDEDLHVGEDVDLVWRIGTSGTVRYEPRSTVAHMSRPTARAWLRQRYGYGTSAAPLARRHGTAVAPLTISSWTAGAWILIGAGAPAAGLAVAAGSSAALVSRLHGLQHPWREAVQLAGLGHLYGGPVLADALRRPWWPFALAGGLASRRGRRAIAVAAVAPLLFDWFRDRPALDPIRWVCLRLTDDIAYGTGVWAGCLHERSFEALRPNLTSWPGRKRAVEAV